ncbi:class I SAM-dependent methyltransferase [Natronomonas gomsonensis]|uniref:class I SAM-dependent methyltransferase n=1 Tax=Natronomonas gomsonensis TaxID=1046043 RepID=UPI0020CA37D6|nr:class I SAM-dependent methyltransferase [Natronomonas gomsonensis]MCY4729415.1 class I SAM-dependent methyltransferase [Natronomonas gomsonensis]
MDETDAFGRMVLDFHRDDYDGSGRYRSHTGATREGHPEWYFGDSFPPESEAALKRVRETGGTVVDAGCGAGSHALALQRKGTNVVATDVSGGALRVARDRGVERVARADLRSLPVVADCVFLAGTQFGVGGTVTALQETLSALEDATTEGGRVVGDFKDPFAVADDHVAGREELLDFDREAGVARRRMRTEYRDLVGPWLDLLCLTPAAAGDAIDVTAWSVTDIIEGDGARYFVVCDR